MLCSPIFQILFSAKESHSFELRNTSHIYINLWEKFFFLVCYFFPFFSLAPYAFCYLDI